MKTYRFMSVVMIVAMLAGLVGFGATNMTSVQLAAAKPERIAIGAMPMAGVHSVPPAKSVVDVVVDEKGMPLDATPEQRARAEKAWYDRFQKQSDTWINPEMQAFVEQREKQLAGEANNLRPDSVSAVVPVTATVFAMAVDFGATETFTMPVNIGYDANGDPICEVQAVTIDGPLVGQVPYPEADDNFTLWYDPAKLADAKYYEKIIFGYEGAGRVRTADMIDPNDGLPGINLAGYTVQDYYDNVAGDGNVKIVGSVEGWITVDHSEGYYGADNCATDSHGGAAGVPVPQLVIDAADEFMAANPTFDWTKYDANHDGFLDTFWIIHAGMGQEGGGGVEGTFAIWSHSSDLRNYANWPNGYQVYEGDPATDADDIYIGPYTMQPEMAETGVFAEEFGHNFFGLPDLYTSEGASNSIGFWNIMAGGAWNGYLGGTIPASMPLWFKMIAAAETPEGYMGLNWHQPMVTRAYNDPDGQVEIGQLEKTPAGANKGVRVNLPAVSEEIANLAGEGVGAYSGTGRNATDAKLTKSLTIPAGAAGVLSIPAYWDIEEDWDYAYVMVNDTLLQDTSGYFVDTNPNGNNLGWGLTGWGEDVLTFDLSAYAGQTVNLTLRYKTDAAVTNPGLWVDDITLDGVLVDDFSAAASNTFPGWTNGTPGWLTVPTVRMYTNYYLVEWRAKTKYDARMDTGYVFIDDDTVERVPYNIPAALVYYRNTKYTNTYDQRSNYYDAPSLGPKYQLLIVDQNWQPMRLLRNGTTYVSRLTGRASSYDAGLTLQPTTAFTITQVNASPAPRVGPFPFPSKPAVTHFNDAKGYYAGLFYGSPCSAGSVCWAGQDDSAVIPARGLYSTRITNFAQQYFYPLFGVGFDPSYLGTGRPAEDNVQHGVNIKLLSKTGDDAYNSLATLEFYNYSVDFLGEVEKMEVLPTGVSVTYKYHIQNVGTENADSIYFDLYLDPQEQLVNYSFTGPVQLAAKKAERTNKVAGDIYLDFTPLPAGSEVIVTVETFIPGPFVSGDPVELYPEYWVGDGQIGRGPYFLNIMTESAANFLFMPAVSK